MSRRAKALHPARTKQPPAPVTVKQLDGTVVDVRPAVSFGKRAARAKRRRKRVLSIEGGER
jgi:hypothetical protein